MKYFRRASLYKNSTGTNKYHVETCEAVSYDWWVYYKQINGLNIFNSYFYSPATSKHQSTMRSFLQSKGVEIDLYVECPEGLQALQSGIELYKDRCNKLWDLIDKKGTKQAKNVERRELIKEYHYKIETLQSLRLAV